MNNRTATAGHLLALGTILIWGTTFISTKVLLRDFSPVAILLIRFLIGYAALWILHPRRFRTRDIRDELLLAAAALAGVTLYFLAENIALSYTLASNVGVIVSVAPLFTAILAHFTLDDEKLRPRFITGFILAITGIVLIAFNGRFIIRVNPLGDVLACLAAVCWAVYSVLMRKISGRGYPTMGCTRRIFLYGLILLIPALLLNRTRIPWPSLTNTVNILNLLFLGLGASALCYVSWNWTVGVLGAVKTSAYIYAIPVITVTASALILREPITAVALAGTALTLAGLYLSEGRPGTRTHKAGSSGDAGRNIAG